MTLNLKAQSICICFILLMFFSACGQQSEDTPSDQEGTGSYRPRLVFPPSVAGSAGLIDCETSGIDTIEFNFILKTQQYGPYRLDCAHHDDPIADIPAGSAMEVEVFADNAAGNALYEGRGSTDIVADQETVGSEITMQPADPSTGAETADDADTADDTDPVVGAQTFTNIFGMTFVRIPAAGRTFQMGSPPNELGRVNYEYSDYEDNEIQHQVRLSEDFYIQETEVTVAQWREVLEAADVSPSTLPREPSFESGLSNYAVDSISWEDIALFLTALNRLGQGTYELPTEAQWEFAARGNTSSALPTGDLQIEHYEHDDNLDRIAWYGGNDTIEHTHVVKQKEPNAYGLYDMHGNVWEWCKDWYAADYGGIPSDGPVVDPTGPADGSDHAMRGGSWSDWAKNCRSASRQPGSIGRNWDNGFRLVWSRGSM